MSVGAVLSSALSFVLKYGAIWFALRAARYLIVLLILDPCRSHLRHLPGPSADGYFSTEVMLDLQAPGYASELHEKYEKEHGKTIRIQGFGYYDPRLTTLDPLSINYILNRAADVFEKPWITQRFVSRLVGGGEDSNPGIFATEGEEHRKLRRLLAPAFSYQSVKRLAPLFLHKSFELRDKLRSVLATEQTASKPGIEVEQPANEPRPRVRLDLHYWIGRATFDIIGVAGFGHEFHSIQEKPNEFYNAYRYMFDACRTQTIVHTVALFFPSWIASRLPDSRSKQVRKSRSMIRTETERLLTNRRNAIAAEKAAGATVDKDFSILNLLLRTNESSGATLTDVQILKQIESIMFTGHDTTSLAIEWGLWELTRYPSIQARLREELAPFASILKDFSSEAPSDAVNTYSDLTGELADLSARLDALPYLENFIREVLRLHPSVQSTLRVATKDDVIPVSEPVRAATGELSKAWIGGSKTGLPAGGIRIRKGEYIHVPIEGFNSSKGVWGEDAFNFNPERWNNLSAAAKSHPGLYAGLMSFSVGPHSCPASRWAILEIKLMIAVLVSSFNFTAASKMNGFNFLVVKPYVDNQFERGHRMPLGLTPIE